jgi:phosphoglycerol transferase MdoB-like AlkP superfamily enzyme
MDEDVKKTDAGDTGRRSSAARRFTDAVRRLAGRVRAFLGAHWPAVSTWHYFLPVAIFAVSMALFSVARLALLLSYPAEFASLTWGATVFAFFKGLLFDAAILLIAIGLPLLAMTMPFGWAASRILRAICGWYSFVILVLMVFTLAGDIIYFADVHRHAGPETWAVGNDLRIVVWYVLSEAFIPLVLFIALVIGGAMLWRRLLRITPRATTPSARGGAISFALVVAMTITIRGGLFSKPLSIADAYEGMSVAGGNLILNGPYALSQSLYNSRYIALRAVPMDEAFAQARRDVASAKDTSVDGTFPFLRERRNAPAASMPNVVIIFFESWNAAEVDAIRRARGKPPHNVTPNFDRLAKEGMLFTRCYASGQRSIQGIAAVLAGVPTLPGMPILGVGLEINALGYLGHAAKRHGYSSYFLQCSPRLSFKLDALSSMAGFDNYFGEEDCPADQEADHRHRMGAWDLEMYTKANEEFAKARKPFIAFLFTLSTHVPVEIPHARFRKFEGDDDVSRYLNGLNYADWALGRFLDMARKSGYYDDTVFVLVSDHVYPLFKSPEDHPGHVHVPLLVAGPGVDRGVSDVIASQADIIPTVMDAAGWTGRYAACGRSLMDRDDPERRFAIAVKGRMVLRIEPGGWVLHDLDGRRAASPGTDAKTLDGMERRLVGFFQVLTDAMHHNRVYREE